MSTENGFAIGHDASRSLLTLTIIGFLDGDTLDQLETAFNREVDILVSEGCRRGALLTLVDLRKQEIQSQEAMLRIKASGELYGSVSRRVAVILSGSALQRMQVKRVSPADNHALFGDEPDALAWLFGPA